jgi:hypothetical protein
MHGYRKDFYRHLGFLLFSRIRLNKGKDFVAVAILKARRTHTRRTWWVPPAALFFFPTTCAYACACATPFFFNSSGLTRERVWREEGRQSGEDSGRTV